MGSLPRQIQPGQYIDEEDDRKAAEAGIVVTEAWFKKIGVPVTLAEADIPAEAIDKLVPDALVTAQNWGLGDLYSEDSINEMFELCV